MRLVFGPTFDTERVLRKKILFPVIGLAFCFYAWQAFAAACQSDRVELQMLGTGGPELFGDRASTGYLIWLDGKARLVVDAGPGTVQRFKQSGADYVDLQAILFTHFHVDHSADFAAYVKGGFFTERHQTLYVFGPSGTESVASAEQFVERMLGTGGLYPYLGNFLAADAPSTYKIRATTIPWSYQNPGAIDVFDSGTIHVTAAPVHHGPFPALGYRVELAGCVISFTGDMSGRLHQMPALARQSDILVAHNAIPEDAEGVPALLHMKPSYIGRLAADAGVKKLILTHLMRRTVDDKEVTTKIIRRHYAGPIEFPDDLDIVRP